MILAALVLDGWLDGHLPNNSSHPGPERHSFSGGGTTTAHRTGDGALPFGSRVTLPAIRLTSFTPRSRTVIGFATDVSRGCSNDHSTAPLFSRSTKQPLVMASAGAVFRHE